MLTIIFLKYHSVKICLICLYISIFTKTIIIKVNVHKYNLLILEVDMCFLTTYILKLFLAIIQSSVFIKYFLFFHYKKY